MPTRNGSDDGKDALARGLGWFSLALGTAQVAAPRGLARMIGLRAGPDQGAVMRVMGLREIATGVGILARPRPAEFLWARVAGDALDLALLMKADAKERGRVAAAIAAVAGVTVPDVIEGARLSREKDGNGTGGLVEVHKAITVRKRPDEVYAFWRQLENLPRFMTHLESVQELDANRSRWKAKGPAARSVEWEAEIVDDRPAERISWRSVPGADVDNSGTVMFRPAPGDRGTEVHVELRYAPPAGQLGAMLAKLLGEEPATQLADDLRRFKQMLETGEIVRSDSTPEGHALAAHLKQRPAQPLETTNGGGR
jgi:uncharacterized membrane protein